MWELNDNDVDDQNILAIEDIWNKGTVEADCLGSEPWSFDISPVGNLFSKLSEYPSLGETANIFQGIGTRADPIFLLKQKGGGLYSEELEEYIEIENDILRPSIKGTDIDRYRFNSHRKLIFPYKIGSGVSLLSTNEIKNQYPKTWKYLNRVKKQLEQREGGKFENTDKWYQYGRPQNMERAGNSKVVIPDVVNKATAALDDGGQHIVDTIYGVASESHDHRFLTALLNSDLLSAFLNYSGTDLRGGYFRMKTAYLNPFPVPDIEPPSTIEDLSDGAESELRSYATGKVVQNELINTDESTQYQRICDAVEIRTEYTNRLSALNLSLQDHLGAYDDGSTLAEIGLTQPPRGSADSILQQTASEKPNLRVGEASVVRESTNTVEIRLTARYKPGEARPEGGSRTGTGTARGGGEDDALDESDFETDQWGYTETDPQAALRITDLTETEADLIEAFVPVAVDEAGGFAGFRETATKTNSLVDRLRKLTLPRVADVEAGLAGYLETNARAEELEAKIESTNALIDEIVYELYGLTDEEIEIVEEAVGE